MRRKRDRERGVSTVSTNHPVYSLHLPLLFHLTSLLLLLLLFSSSTSTLCHLISSHLVSFLPCLVPKSQQPANRLGGGGGASPMSLEPLQLASESSESPSISSRQLILTHGHCCYHQPSQPNLLSRQPASQPCIALCIVHAHRHTPNKSRCVVRASGIATPARRYGGRVVLRASCCCRCCCCHV